MSRVTRPAKKGWMTRLALRYAARTYGQLPEPVETWAHHPGVFWTWSIGEMGVLRSWRSLPKDLASLAELRAASVIGCPWCLDFGTVLARRSGVTESQLRELHRWRDSDVFDERQSLVLAYTDAMTATPMTVTDELVDQLRQHFDDQQLIELTAFIAVENQRSRFNHALGLQSQGFTTGECALATSHAAATA